MHSIERMPQEKYIVTMFLKFRFITMIFLLNELIMVEFPRFERYPFVRANKGIVGVVDFYEGVEELLLLLE